MLNPNADTVFQNYRIVLQRHKTFQSHYILFKCFGNNSVKAVLSSPYTTFLSHMIVLHMVTILMTYFHITPELLFN